MSVLVILFTHKLTNWKKDTKSQLTQHKRRTHKSDLYIRHRKQHDLMHISCSFQYHDNFYIISKSSWNSGKFFKSLPTTLNIHTSSSEIIRHSHLAVIQKHAVHLLDGAISRVLGLKMDKGVPLGAVFITHHLQCRETHIDTTMNEGSSFILKQVRHLESGVRRLKSVLSLLWMCPEKKLCFAVLNGFIVKLL